MPIILNHQRYQVWRFCKLWGIWRYYMDGNNLIYQEGYQAEAQKYKTVLKWNFMWNQTLPYVPSSGKRHVLV